MRTRKERLDAACMSVLFDAPFFAPGVARLPVVFDDSVERACTDGKQVRWSGKWFDSLPDEVLPTVLAHEACHCMLGHLWRAPDGADHGVWNQATDHAVNLMLKDFAALVKPGMPDPFPFPKPDTTYCADPKFKGMAEEAIYATLANQQGGGNGRGKAPQPAKTSLAGGTGQSGGSPSKATGKGNSAQSGPSANSAGQAPEPHSMPSFGDFEPQGAEREGGKELETDWQATLLQSAKLAQGRGELPGAIARLVGELVSPKVSWQHVLRNFLREKVADDWDWQTPDLAMDESGFILPCLNSERLMSVVFATDTSGSISQDVLTAFQAEKQNCLDEMRPAKLVDIYCDAAVQLVKEYAPGDNIGKGAPGGGGTDFAPVWNEVQKLHPAPKAIVYLTDLYGSFGDDPGVPVIWVVWGGNESKPPFGEVVSIAT